VIEMNVCGRDDSVTVCVLDLDEIVGEIAHVVVVNDRDRHRDVVTADGFAIVDANAGLRWRIVEAGVDIQNLFNSTWREVNFATDSRLSYEPKVVTGINYSPGWPFTAIGRLTLYWH